jgi:MFS family permease
MVTAPEAGASAQLPRATAGWELAAWYGLAVLILVSVAGNANGQVIALLTEPMKKALDLSDTQIAALRGVATTVVVAIASYPIAWLADRIDRRIVYAACMLIWAAANIGVGLSTSFPMLMGFAMGMAFGEAVLGPVTFALIPDLFSPARRMLANSIFFISQLLGISAGLIFGGWLIRTVETTHATMPPFLAGLDPWRVTIMAAAVPTLVLIPFVLTMRLKRRPPPDRAADAPPLEGILPFMKAHVRTLFPIFIGFGLIGAANFVPLAWLSVIIIRTFGEQPADVGVDLGRVFAVSSVLGVVVANLVARQMAKTAPDTAPIRVAQLGALVSLSATLLYLFAQSPAQFYVIAVFQLAASFGGLVLSPTITQNVTPPRIRARIIALGGMFYIGFGALSPLLVGMVSDGFGDNPRGLLYAMLIVGTPAFAAGILVLQLALKSLPATLAAVRDEA